MDTYYSQLLDYVREALSRGYPEDAIRAALTHDTVDSQIIDRLLLDARPIPNAQVRAGQNPIYIALAKFGTISIVAAIIFLVRTTGALQQAVAAPSTDSQPSVARSPEPASSVARSPTPDDNSSSTSSAPTPTSTPAASSAPQPTSQAPAPTAQPLKTTPSPTPAPTPTPTPTPSPTPPPPTYTYRNGTYTAIGSNDTPAGTQKISITLVVTNDIVTDTSATNMATDPRSSNYENIFISNYKSLVVGKPLKTLSLGKVSSASLTPIGFNNAASAIRSQAV